MLTRFGSCLNPPLGKFFGNQERQFERLAGIKSWITGRMIAV